MEHRAFLLSKDGNCQKECEDAFAADPKYGRFAVSDGATESVFAREWAQLLVNEFVAEEDCGTDQLWTTWLPRVQEHLSEQFQGRELPWYGEAKWERGAFATFLGVIVEDDSTKGPRVWRAIAVGDTCLFHTRGPRLLHSLPVTKPDLFDDFPNLVGSRTPPETVREQANHAFESLKSGDRLWLVTDALAKWCLSEHEAGRDPWSTLEQFFNGDDRWSGFAAWVQELREEQAIHNDDVTLIAIKP